MCANLLLVFCFRLTPLSPCTSQAGLGAALFDPIDLDAGLHRLIQNAASGMGGAGTASLPAPAAQAAQPDRDFPQLVATYAESTAAPSIASVYGKVCTSSTIDAFLDTHYLVEAAYGLRILQYTTAAALRGRVAAGHLLRRAAGSGHGQQSKQVRLQFHQCCGKGRVRLGIPHLHLEHVAKVGCGLASPICI